MRRTVYTKLMIVLLLSLLMGVASPAMAAERQAPRARPMIDENAPSVPGEMVVIFQPGTDHNEVGRSASAMGASVTEYDAETGFALLALGNPTAHVTNATAIQALDASNSVLAAEPNYIYSVDPATVDASTETAPAFRSLTVINATTGLAEVRQVSIPSIEALSTVDAESISFPVDTSYDDWNWYSIGTDVVWKDATLSNEVAVVDTGVDNLHPDLSGYVTLGPDYVNNDTIAMDDNGHGTHVAGIIAARNNNKVGVHGVSNARIYAVKVLDAQGNGSSYDVARGIVNAADRLSVKVINLSLGGDYSSAIETALQRAQTNKKLVVIAAGNNNKELYCGGANPTSTQVRLYPACNKGQFPDTIIVVGAGGDDADFATFPGIGYLEETCQGGYHGAKFSNYGTNIDIVAPGAEITSTVPTKPVNNNAFNGLQYYEMSGTSMAAPHVAAAAARVWAENPTGLPTPGVASTPAGIRARLLSSGVAIDTSCWPAGQVSKPYLWMPGAVQQSSFSGTAYNGDTGAGIPGLAVQARRGAAILSSDTICAQSTCTDYFLSAIPVGNGTLANIDVWFSSVYHTAGYQKYFVNLDLDPVSGGGYGRYEGNFAVLPALAPRWNFITTWNEWRKYDLDAYMFLPTGTPGGYVVPLHPGADPPSDEGIDPLLPFVWIGGHVPDKEGVTDNNIWGIGDLATAPRVRLMFESSAAVTLQTNPEPLPPDPNPDLPPGELPGTLPGFAPFDHIALQKNGTIPFYAGLYTFIVANHWTDMNLDGSSADDTHVSVGDVPGTCAYVWNQGVLLQPPVNVNRCLNTADPDGFWIVGSLNGTIFTWQNALVVDNYNSYTSGSRTFSTFGEPGAGPIPPQP